MEDVEKIMKELKIKRNPTQFEVQKYVRYLVNVKKFDLDRIIDDVDWDIDKIKKAYKEVERENSKPRPKRYYVSLKEPLETDSF